MSVISKVEELITPLLTASHMELVDVQIGAEAGKKLLRIFIDKEGGMKLQDCEDMSRAIGDLIDDSKLFPEEAYVLEISSPGLDRVLKKEKDFVRFTGKTVRISLYAPIEGQRNFLGKMLSAGEGHIVINDNTTGKTVRIELTQIARARLEPDIQDM